MSDWKLIIPYLRPIEHLIVDDEVSEIMCNPGGAVFLERAGRLEPTSVQMGGSFLETAIRNIARGLQMEVCEKTPLLDARLPDGSRVAATWRPISVGGASLTIRKFQSKRFTGEDLVGRGALTVAQLEALVSAVKHRETILISGGTGAGKSSVLNALAEYIPPEERIVLIEDTAELSLNQPNLVRLEARRELAELPAITIQMLVRQSLRMRPDRLIVGEVRGAEGWDLLQALNTGHEGSLSTIHGNSALGSFLRLRTCIAMAGMDLPPPAIAQAIAEAVRWLVHIKRLSDGTRVVTEVLMLNDYNAAADSYEVTRLCELVPLSTNRRKEA